MTVELLVILGVILVFVVIFVGFVWSYARRARRATRDDLLRAGNEAGVSPKEAYDRAQGKTAWTRIGGGGV